MIDIKAEPGIYKITSPSGRIYIGQSVNIRKRYFTYKRLSCVNQPVLYNSFIKYGFDKHYFDVIEYCKKGEYLNSKERFWQEYFNCTSKMGLNCVLQETISEKRELTEELKNKKSKVIIDLNLKKKQNIYQYDKNGNFLKKWNNTSEILLFYPNIKISCLNKCLNNKYLMWNTYGFIWKKDELLTNEQLAISKKRIENHEKNKTIIQYDLHGKIIKEWESSEQIKKEINLQVDACINGKVSNVVGFIWKRKTDNFDFSKHIIGKINKRKVVHNYPIYQYNKEGNLIKYWRNFEIQEGRGHIVQCLNNKRNTFNNFVWSKTPLSFEEIEIKFDRLSIPILQYTLEGEFIKKWSSGKEIVRVFKTAMANLDKNKFTKKVGFLWKPMR